MSFPDFVDEANQLHDHLLDPPAVDRARAVALIRTSLSSAFAAGKVAGIDTALAILNAEKKS